MALISCKNCGKPVSDSAVKCPHCGELLITDAKESESAEPVPPQKQFDKLTNQEKNALREEFYRKYPAFRIPERNRKRITKIINIVWCFCGGLALSIGLLLIFLNYFWWAIGLTIGFLVIAIAVPILIGTFYTDRKLNWQSRATTKKFNCWLEHEKNIVGEALKFDSPKMKDRYDAIDPDEEVKKWRL